MSTDAMTCFPSDHAAPTATAITAMASDGASNPADAMAITAMTSDEASDHAAPTATTMGKDDPGRHIKAE